MAKQTFAMIPNSLLRRTDISHGAKLCCARLIQYAGKKGVAFPKVATLAAECGMSKRATHRFLDELKEKGLITSKQRGLRLSNEYYLDKSVLIHRIIPELPKVALPEKPKPARPDVPDEATLYTKEERDQGIKSIDEITKRLGDKMRVTPPHNQKGTSGD